MFKNLVKLLGKLSRIHIEAQSIQIQWFQELYTCILNWPKPMRMLLFQVNIITKIATLVLYVFKEITSCPS